MKTFTVAEAKADLDAVLEHAKQGGTVIIVGEDDQAYELVATILPKQGPRKAGRLKGLILRVLSKSQMNFTNLCPSSSLTWNELSHRYVDLAMVRQRRQSTCKQLCDGSPRRFGHCEIYLSVASHLGSWL